MKLHTDPATAALNTVTAYGDGYIEVNQVRFSSSVAFGPEGEVTPWPVQSPADITPTLLRQAAGLSEPVRDPLAFLDEPEATPSRPANAPEVLLVGTGGRQQFLRPEVLRPLLAAGIGVEIMDTHAASRTYNILMAEGRRVVVALIPPQRRLPDMMMPIIGKPAPLFTAESTIGPISLEQCQGRAVILYFYPKDNTPGCTTESQDFRDLHADFLSASAVVVGISRDSLKSHENFKAKYELPFPLISDADETVCNLYGVIKQKNMYGKQVRGIERSTFLIDAYGVLVQEWRGVKVPGHAKEVLQAAKSIG